jgi:hypothetical protein
MDKGMQKHVCLPMCDKNTLSLGPRTDKLYHLEGLSCITNKSRKAMVIYHPV